MTYLQGRFYPVEVDAHGASVTLPDPAHTVKAPLSDALLRGDSVRITASSVSAPPKVLLSTIILALEAQGNVGFVLEATCVGRPAVP